MKKLTNGQTSTLKKISAAIIATFVEFSTQTKMPTGGQVPESLPLGQAKEAVKVAPMLDIVTLTANIHITMRVKWEKQSKRRCKRKLNLRGRLFIVSNL